MGNCTQETIAELRRLAEMLENGEAQIVATRTDTGFSLVQKHADISHPGGRAALSWEVRNV